LHATPTIVPSNGRDVIPVTVSTTTSESIIAAGQNRSAAHNALVLSQTGRRVGGGKRSKRSDHKKRSRKSKRSKRARKSKRSKRSKRSRKSKRSKSKRGGQPTPTPSPSPTPKPTVLVPQFLGAHNAGANGNSLSSNHVAMIAGAQAALDNPNAAPSSYSVY
jgi:hypothetical protein